MVGAAALRGAEVFVAQRPAGSSHGGLWEFPGGKVEVGESDADALVRELREELTVDATVGELLAVGRDDRVELFVYAVSFAGAPSPTEGQLCAWVSAEALEALPVPPADVPAVRAVIERLSRVY